MEGYSVTEAASVLGVPTERVWELLARGVLSGAPEGETGMRVYLQPRPAPAPPEAKRPNGNGRRDEPELSPFRELLTEFRGLTERYGQALLALGEARGEVATLRSRVDLLEARMDLRLPTSSPSAAASWASTPTPFPAERAVVPTVSAPYEPPLAGEPEAEEEEPRSRTRGPRRATASFAEALARAEDPSIPELPGAAESAAAIATLRAETDAALPRDLPSADAVPVAEESDTSVAAAPVEMPEAVVEESDAPAPLASEPVLETVAEVPAAPAHVAPDETVEEVAEEPADAAAHAEPDETVAEVAEQAAAGSPKATQAVETDVGSAEGVGQEEADVAVEVVADFDVEEPSAETQEITVASRQAEPAVDAEPVTADEPAPEPVATEPLAWDSDRYTTAIEEPDWFAGEAIEAAVEEPAAAVAEHEPTQAISEPVAEPPVVEDAEGGVADAMLDVAAEAPTAAEPTAPAPSEEADEETMLWFGRAVEDSGGASEMEVATTGTRSPVEPAEAAARSFPGSSELDDALAALGVPAAGQDQHTAESAAADQLESEPASVEDADADEWPPRSTFTDSARPFPPSSPGTSATTSSASRAYRRLRRIFPG